MGGISAAIEVGKRQLEIALGSAGGRFAEPNEPRAIKRLSARLAQAGCARVLLEGGLVPGPAGGGAAGGGVAHRNH